MYKDIQKYKAIHPHSLGIIQIIFKVNFNHSEERPASQKGVRARLKVLRIFECHSTVLLESMMDYTNLMLGPNSLNFQSISNLLRKNMSSCFQHPFVCSRLGHTCRPPFRFLQLFIRYLTSYMFGKYTLRVSKNSASPSGRFTLVSMLKKMLDDQDTGDIFSKQT